MMALLRSLSTLKLSGRGRKFGLFFVSSIGSRAVGIACQLLQVPIALKAMGTEAFGLWVTLSSLTYLLNFADLGVGVGVQNKLAEAFSLGRQREARTLFNSAFAFLLMIGLGLALILVPGSLLISAEHAFGLKNAQVITEAPGALVAMLLWFCVNLPIGLAQRLAYGLQKGWMHNVSQAAGSALSLAGLAIAAHFRVSLGWMLAAAVFPSVLTSLGLLGLLLRQLHWLTLRGFEFRLEPLRSLLRLGFLFSVQQVSATVLFALPALVISNTLGAAAVTPYNLTQRLFNLFGVIQNAFMLPLWPAYAEANARGEMGWIRKTLNRSLLATFFLSILPMAVGTLLAPAILRIWVGKATDTVMPSHALLWLLFGWNALIFLQQPFGYLLAGVSEVKRLTVYSLLTVLLTVPLMLFMVGPWHQEGVIFALIAASLPFNLLGSVVETVRFLRGRSGSPGPVPAPEKPPSHDNTEDSSLTAIICTYNNAKCLGQTLAHLTQQSGGGHLIQVIVVDNNSTDETAAVVRSFQSRLPNLRYTVEQRQGTGHARQRGIAECTTGWLAFIDDDNYVAPGWAGAALEFIAAHPGCGVFGGKVTILWEQPPERLVRESGYAYAELDLGSNPQLLTGHMRWLVPGAGMVIRRRALIQSEWTQWTFCAGRAKQGVGVAGDDTEIVARVAREGWEIWYNPACQLNHFIVARRISNGYLAKLHFGFGTAEPVLRGLTRSDTFGMWFVRMLARLFVLAWFVLREVPLTPFGSYRRARLLVWFSYFRGAIAGLRAPFDFTPGERRRWLGHPASSPQQTATAERA